QRDLHRPAAFLTGAPDEEMLRRHLLVESRDEIVTLPVRIDETDVGIGIDERQKPRVVGDAQLQRDTLAHRNNSVAATPNVTRPRCRRPHFSMRRRVCGPALERSVASNSLLTGRMT